MNDLDTVISANRNGGPALPSVCSAHEDVLEASMRLAEALDAHLEVKLDLCLLQSARNWCG